MGDLSKHFSRYEFVCKCGNCGHIAVDIELIKVLEDVHNHFGNTTMSISSGNRCPVYTADEKDCDNTKHLYCIACDFRVAFTRADYVADYLEGKYPNK